MTALLRTRETMNEQTPRLLEDLEVFVRRVAEEVVAHARQRPDTSPEAEEISARLARIRAKDSLTAAEAALLLGCSDGHLRNLVREAKKGRKRHPVPFRDLDGVYTFPREELLRWAAEPKVRLRAAASSDATGPDS